MITIEKSSFTEISKEIEELFLTKAKECKVERWQGVEANQETRELQNVVFSIHLNEREGLDYWRGDIKPNLPWADVAFEERVCGEPLNPGKAWEIWPWSSSASAFKSKRFNHHYNERLWPRFVRRTPSGELPIKSHDHSPRKYPPSDFRPQVDPSNNHVGDLWDLVLLLANEPYTRQAVIPLFWPSETGKGDGGRKMCSLLYHFLMRDNKLSIYYPLRSCDFIRHWRDDCYLAVRLLIWVIEQCRKINPEVWDKVHPGEYLMHCSSLHIFATDHLQNKKS